MSPITSGPPSWPRSTPVEKVHATRRFLTFSLVICLSELYRWFCMLPACIAHWDEFCVCLITSPLASAPETSAQPSSALHVYPNFFAIFPLLENNTTCA